jgi:VanZ family protein
MDTESDTIPTRGVMEQTQFIRWRLPVILYALFILFLTSYPKLEIPNVGFSWDDKIFHFGAYGIFGLLLARATTHYSPKKWYKGIFIATTIGVVFGIFDELHQSIIPGRYTEFADLMADIAGILAAQVTFLLLANYFSRKSHVHTNSRGG